MASPGRRPRAAPRAPSRASRCGSRCRGRSSASSCSIVEHLVPAARAVQAERRAAVGLGRERVLHLVAVVERPPRRATIGSSGGSAMPGDAAQRVADPGLLRRELRLVGEILEAAAAAGRVVRRTAPRRAAGPASSTSVATASAWRRCTFVTRARTVSPGRPRRTKTTNRRRARATPFPPKASESICELELLVALDGRGHVPRLQAGRRRKRGERPTPLAASASAIVASSLSVRAVRAASRSRCADRPRAAVEDVDRLRRASPASRSSRAEAASDRAQVDALQRDGDLRVVLAAS